MESFGTLVNDTVQSMKIGPDLSEAEILRRGQVFLEAIFRVLSNNPAITRVGFYQATDSVRIKAEMAEHIKNICWRRNDGAPAVRNWTLN